MCVDYYVDNVDNVETKLHIMLWETRKMRKIKEKL